MDSNRYKNEEEQARVKTFKTLLNTAICSDVMDDLGFRNQAMSSRLRPLRDDFIIAGRAKTILAVDIYHAHENPYELEIKALDSVCYGEVIIGCTNKSEQNSIWGELLSTAAKARGANGAIIDGLARDIRKILELDFPCFITGIKPTDSKGRGIVIDYDCPVVCGGVLVEPGDFIFADFDGVVSIPSKILDDVMRLSKERLVSENLTKNALLQGRFLSDVYKEYGVL
jgi:regulator of RNase E activity RraA